MTTKTFRGKLQDGKIEWIGEPPKGEGEVRVTIVRPRADREGKVFMKPGMFGPPRPSNNTAEEDIRFIKSLVEYDEDEHVNE